MNSPRLTSSQIGRLAGVSRAAVTNWRQRHCDFPRPDDHPTHPTFDQAEIEAWLRDHGKVQPTQARPAPAGDPPPHANVQRILMPLLRTVRAQERGAWLPINEIADCTSDHHTYERFSAAADRLIKANRAEKLVIYFGSRPVAALRVPVDDGINKAAIQRRVNRALADIGHRVTVTEAQKAIRNFTEANVTHDGQTYRVYHWTHRYTVTLTKPTT